MLLNDINLEQIFRWVIETKYRTFTIFLFCIYKYWFLTGIPSTITKQVFLRVCRMRILAASFYFLENSLRVLSWLTVLSREKLRKNVFSHASIRLGKSEVGTESAVNE